jgi:hypothetical protein
MYRFSAIPQAEHLQVQRRFGLQWQQDIVVNSYERSELPIQVLHAARGLAISASMVLWDCSKDPILFP